MVSRAEQRLSQGVRALPDGFYDGGKPWMEALSSLDWLLSELLRASYAEWEGEGLDGISPFVARKSEAGELEVFGWAWVLSTQAILALHTRLQVAERAEELSWLECRLGEREGDGRTLKSYPNREVALKILYPREPDQIEWYYRITLGERCPGAGRCWK